MLYLPATYHSTYSGDLTLAEDFTRSVRHFNTINTTTTVNNQFEEFSHDDSVTTNELDCTDLDPILEICVDENSKGTSLSLVDSNEPHVQLPSPDKEFMDLLVEHSSGNTGAVQSSRIMGDHWRGKILHINSAVL